MKLACSLNSQPSCLSSSPLCCLVINIVFHSGRVVNPPLMERRWPGQRCHSQTLTVAAALTESRNHVRLGASQGLAAASSTRRPLPMQEAKLRLAAFSQPLTKMVWEPREMRRLCLRAVC